MPDSLPPAPDIPQRCQVCAARHGCLVGQLPHAQQVRLDPLIREVVFRKGDALQTEALDVTAVSSVKLGTVMLTRTGPDAASRPVALVGQGHLLGLLGLLGQPTLLGAHALSAGRVCELPAASLRHTLGRDPAQLDTLHRQISQTLSGLADWGHVMRLRGLPRQLVATLMILAREQGTRTVHLPSHVALAALLSTTRESVARTLRQLQDSGIVHRNDRWHVELTGTHRQVFRGD